MRRTDSKEARSGRVTSRGTKIGSQQLSITAAALAGSAAKLASAPGEAKLPPITTSLAGTGDSPIWESTKARLVSGPVPSSAGGSPPGQSSGQLSHQGRPLPSLPAWPKATQAVAAGWPR